MAQLGRFSYPVQDTSGNAIAGASVAVYREGATVNGNQSGTSPTTFTVRHRGKIVTGDNVFVNAATGTLYAATVVSATQITLGGYVGILSLNGGDRLTPSGSQPTLYADDQGGATTSNPLTSSSTGRVSCWMEYGAYDLVLSGGGLTATSFTSEVMPTEAPARNVFAESFGLTVAGVQQALDEIGDAGGGTVWIPANAGVTIGSTSVKIPNRTCLRGFGDHGSSATFTANASTNVSAMVENKTQDGTQQCAYVEGVFINGNKASGALVTRGLNMKAVYVGTRIKDVLITGCSGNGLVIDGSTAAVGAGQLMWDNITVTTCNDDNILITGPVDSVYGFQTTSESVAAGKAMMRITNSTATASRGHCFVGVHMEGTAASDGVVLDGCCNVFMNNVVWDGGAAQLNVIKITGTVTGSDGAFASGGHTFHNVSGNLATIIDDQVSSITVGSAQGRFVQTYMCPRQVQSGGNDLYTGQIIGVQYQRQGINITASATITPGNGNYFEVDGNTNITSVTAAARDKGRVITLMFNGTPTFTDGSNLKLAGNLVATADDTITLVCDGTNWREIARSVN